MITKTDVLAVAPELSGLTDPQWTAIIGMAYAQMGAAVWDTWLDMGATWLAAHIATVGPFRGGSGGAVQSETVGQVSRSYAVRQLQVGESMESTAYGQEFTRLARMLPGARLPVIA